MGVSLALVALSFGTPVSSVFLSSDSLSSLFSTFSLSVEAESVLVSLLSVLDS